MSSRERRISRNSTSPARIIGSYFHIKRTLLMKKCKIVIIITIKASSSYSPRSMLPPIPKSPLKDNWISINIYNLSSTTTGKVGKDQQNKDFWKKNYLVGYIPAPGPGKRSLPPMGWIGGYTIL
jgi:hypothetical protein